MEGEMKTVTLAHGSGGKLMHQMIDELFRKRFDNELLDELGDSALIDLKNVEGEDAFSISFTTDSYVVKPIIFPGGDIGKLAVCGTINDLAVTGAIPKYISCSVIIEEGLGVDVLERIVDSMQGVAFSEGVKIVTGDLKVVEKGGADKIFINTSGIGVRRNNLRFSKERIAPGDRILINGTIGDHGAAIIVARGEFDLNMTVSSDCSPLTGLIRSFLQNSDEIKFMRDPTRGGLASTLNEIVDGMDFGILLHENKIPIKGQVKAMCEILGLDPVYIGNEGKVVVVVSENVTESVLERMKNHPLGIESALIGEVVDQPKGKVFMKTEVGGTRIVDMMVGDQLPRIC
jgi:hydrogenase expression/formation protein HypE